VAGGGGELEALDPLGDDVGAGAPTSEGGHRRRRRWPIVAVAAVVVTVAIGFPVRDRLARREFHDLQHQWAVALADDTERGEAENRLRIRAVATNDEAFVDAALAALYREEQRRFDESRARLHRSLLVAPSVISIRAALATALARRSILLGRVAAYWDHPVGGSPPPNADDQTAADGHRVDVALSTARAHFGERQQSSASAVAYGAERSAMSRLSHWLDQRTGTVLLAGAREQLLRLDIDASRVTATDVHSPSGDFVMRQGYLAYTSGSEAWAVSPDGSGPPPAPGRGGVGIGRRRSDRDLGG
jgi:hypothetical protein